MATIRVRYRLPRVAETEGSIFYELRHAGKVRQLASEYRASVGDWSEIRSKLAVISGKMGNEELNTIRDGIICDVQRIANIDGSLRALGIVYDVNDVIEGFKRYKLEFSLFSFMERCIEILHSKGQLRTAETYRSTLNSFKKFRLNKDIMLDCISAYTMKEYETWLGHRGIVPNTTSFYMRILRAVYNRAIQQGVIEDRKPFKFVYTGVAKTAKRALPLEVIRNLKRMDLSDKPRLEFARDMFLLSFYLRGISFVDMASLMKKDLRNGHVCYHRRKTGQCIVIEWTKEMQNILDHYPSNDSEYLLPILTDTKSNTRGAYRNMRYNINHNLKKLGLLLGITSPLTLYVARHTWASIAKAKGLPLSVISEGLGHERESTTQIYLANLDTESVDIANKFIIRLLE